MTTRNGTGLESSDEGAGAGEEEGWSTIGAELAAADPAVHAELTSIARDIVQSLRARTRRAISARPAIFGASKVKPRA